MTGDPHAAARRRMLDIDLAGRGIRDGAVLDAMARVRRERFLPPGLAQNAYDDGPLPIGYAQTISQPYVVALMLELAEPGRGKRALEIGTGSGYQAAVMAEVFREVVTVERVPGLADTARRRLASLGYDTVAVIEGDGTVGYAPSAPYDAIIVAAAPERGVPAALEEQLAEGGRLVIPVGAPGFQNLLVGTKKGGKMGYDRRGAVRFVPFVTGPRRS